MEKDEIFEMAERYVKATGRSVFLMGKAGTGKTTFLKYVTQTTTKRFVVLAPTGVAAINAGGSTIHSFFQLPLCPYLPDVKELVTEYQMPEQHRSLRKDRVKIIRTLDLLIIDDLGKEKATEWTSQTIYSIINARYENERPIVITTNYTLKNLVDRMTPSGSQDSITAAAAVDRLFETCIEVPMLGPSWRKSQRVSRAV